MLNAVNPNPTIGVKNLEMARQFYEKKLGLVPEGNPNADVQFYRSGNSSIEIYKSDFAGTNKATSLTWGVGDKLKEEVEALRAKGIEFEHYQMPSTQLQGDIHVMQEGMKAVWFKDPDGNTLCIHDQ